MNGFQPESSLCTHVCLCVCTCACAHVLVVCACVRAVLWCAHIFWKVTITILCAVCSQEKEVEEKRGLRCDWVLAAGLQASALQGMCSAQPPACSQVVLGPTGKNDS